MYLYDNILLEWEMFQTKVVEKIKQILCSIIFFFENRAAYLEKYCTAGRATDDNMAHAH